MGVNYISLKGLLIPNNVLNLVNEESAESHQIVPFYSNGKDLYLAMSDPTDFEIINFLERKTGLIVRPFFTFKNQISLGLSQYKKDLNAEFSKMMAESKVPGEDLSKAAEDLPTVQMMNTIIQYAIAKDASDIHIEGQEQNTLVRFRIDGILHDMLVLAKNVQTLLVARIKYLSNLKIDEHRLPQDGRFKFEDQYNHIAMRISVLPTNMGENVVMRLLPETAKAKTLIDLGFSDKNMGILTQEIKRTNGMILMTGPTGSGKTTTLYTLLEMLNKPEVKISTIEDPVEYGIPRVTQTQVNLETGLTFATGLRSLLRHDPNIIMVGEIRDHETADIAINAALTGHLVLSTLHTNDSTSSLSRLIDLGTEPFLISETVRAIVGQRLVRRLCNKCKRQGNLEEAQLIELARFSHYPLETLKQQRFFLPVGCDECTAGYKGRIGIHEVFAVDEKVRSLIVSRASNDTIRNQAISDGMITMLQDGVVKAAHGLTTISEILREIGRGD